MPKFELIDRDRSFHEQARVRVTDHGISEFGSGAVDVVFGYSLPPSRHPKELGLVARFVAAGEDPMSPFAHGIWAGLAPCTGQTERELLTAAERALADCVKALRLPRTG